MATDKLLRHDSSRLSSGRGSHALLIHLCGEDAEQLAKVRAVVQAIDGGDLRELPAAGREDPLVGVEELPDLLLLILNVHWREQLNALAHRSPDRRPRLIVIGDALEQEAMRLAMKAGAMDYLFPDFDEDELRSTLELLHQELAVVAPPQKGQLISVLNAKGGAGGSMLACNIAHVLTEHKGPKVALVDMDFQFGSLSYYLDMEPKYGIVEVLQNIYHVDAMALEGYLQKHSSGLRLLDVKPGRPITMGAISPDHIGALLDLLVDQYDETVLDLSRRIDELSRPVLERSSHILIVLQQSISHLRDAKRLLDILQKDYGIRKSKICIVVNRYDRKSELTLSDISRAMGIENLQTIPSAFAAVNQAINEGQPIATLSAKSAIARSIRELSEGLVQQGDAKTKSAGIVRRVLKNFKGA